MREYTTEALLIQQARACFLERAFSTFCKNEALGKEVTGNDPATAAIADFFASTEEHRNCVASEPVNIIEFPQEHSGWPRSA